MILHVSKNFLRRYKKIIRKNPERGNKIKNTISLFQSNPKHPAIRLHKLQGKMVMDWSITVEEDLRIIFIYVDDGILLVDIDKHEEVYKN